MRRLIGLPILALLAAFYPLPSFQAPDTDLDKVTIGTLVLDGQVITAFGFLVPITGDDNLDATATLEYKPTAGGSYVFAMDLIRVNPQYSSPISQGQSIVPHPANPPSLVGILTGLTPDTSYDIRVTVSDPDGEIGATIQTLTVSTREIPPANPDTSDTINVTNVAELETAISTAAAGDIIAIAAGTYTLTSNLELDADGTEANPIFIRCADRATTIIDRNARDNEFSKVIWVRSDWVTIEDCTIRNANTGIHFHGASDYRPVEGNVVRRNIFDRVNDGVSAGIGWGTHNAFIYENLFEGPRDALDDLLYPQGQDEGGGKASGVEVVGTSIEIWNNTFSAFIDSFGVSNVQAVATVGVFAHHNKVTFGADDCFEFDFSNRNVAMYENYCANTAAGISYQPVFDGPVYAWGNIIYNVNRGPLKINAEGSGNDAFGMRIFHNTFIKNDEAWIQFGADPGDAWIVNNLFVGQGDVGIIRTLKSTSIFNRTIFNYNAWTEDFNWEWHTEETGQQYGANFDEWNDGPAGINDVLLAGETVFANVTLDFDVNDWTVNRDPDAVGLDFHLDAGSSAINTGAVIVGFNDGYGSTPDIGAFADPSVPMPAHGVTWLP